MNKEQRFLRFAVPVFFMYLCTAAAAGQNTVAGQSAAAGQSEAIGQNAAGSGAVFQTGMYTFEKLQEAYTAQDYTLQTLILEYERALITGKKTVLQNGTAVTVSTGALGVGLSDTEGTVLSASPEISVSVPALDNMRVTASLPVSITVPTDSSGAESPEFDGAGIVLSRDLVSSTKKDRAVTLEKAARSVLEAERAVQQRRKTVYKNFLSAVREIAAYELAAAQARDSLIEEQLEFEQIKAKGYAEKSSQYRTAQLEVKKAEQEVQKQERLYLAAASGFYKDCGIENAGAASFEGSTSSVETASSGGTSSVGNGPSGGTSFGAPNTVFSLEIPFSPLSDVSSFDPENYEAVESARWTSYINSLDRDTDPPFTLSAEGGYGWSKQNASDGGSSSAAKDTHSLDSALVFSINGLELKAGVSLPFKTVDGWGFSNPSFSLSAGWNPQTAKIENLSDEDEKLAAASEMLSIKKAFDAYQTDIDEKETEYRDLLWKKENYENNLAMYSELAADTAVWHQKGLISLTEYRQAQSNYETARLYVYLTHIDFLLFNAECAEMFITANERKGNSQ